MTNSSSKEIRHERGNDSRRSERHHLSVGPTGSGALRIRSRFVADGSRAATRSAFGTFHSAGLGHLAATGFSHGSTGSGIHSRRVHHSSRSHGCHGSTISRSRCRGGPPCSRATIGGGHRCCRGGLLSGDTLGGDGGSNEDDSEKLHLECDQEQPGRHFVDARTGAQMCE
ncbi:hypothetical protein GN244_ATG02280 [Phytophthora infestans]|uniref:Uncharacterized protein n=1 Tax=Phytophthora infestans TaxID=4787 RepID=A0A833TLD0_PHYIN|nr:hypothetical protein GN244_ATG02280 [Phytophthora infestans]KAF4132068.1 hypothetical protein GN958_ATG18738 [Phytophthora infestans]